MIRPSDSGGGVVWFRLKDISVFRLKDIPDSFMSYEDMVKYLTKK